MNAFATITLALHGLEIRCPAANLREDRPPAADDGQRLQDWAKRYLAAAGKDDHHETLLETDREMHAWLNGPTSSLTRALDSATAPLGVEFGAARQDERDLAVALLHAPWEPPSGTANISQPYPSGRASIPGGDDYGRGPESR